jgi:hypothetical protein
MSEFKSADNENRIIISESTPIRIGLVIGFLSIFATSIWWASSINSKLDSILSYQSLINTSIAELKASDIVFGKDLAEFKLRQALDEAAIKALQDKAFGNH